MRKRIGILLICTLMIFSTTSLALTTLKRDEKQIKQGFFDTTPVPSPKSSNGWTKIFGGKNFDGGRSVQQTSDEGYIISGYTYSFGAGESDIWLIKTNGKGLKIWDKTFGGNDHDRGFYVQQTNDEGYIITGFTDSYGAGISDVWLIKTNSNGIEEWNRTFGGNSSDWGYSVQQTIDGGYIITGMTGLFGVNLPDIWLIKTNVNGTEEWNKTFGGKYIDYGHSIQQTIDEGYIITGFTDSYGAGEFDIWLIKTNSNGTEEWNRTFGGNSSDWGYSVQQTIDEGYIITGYTDSYGAGLSDVWLIKTNVNGTEEWNKTFGGKYIDYGHSIQQTIDEGYIITGFTDSYGAGISDVWLIKTNVNGTEEWNRTFGGNSSDWGYSVQQTIDEGYIITGYIDSYFAGGGDVCLIKTDSMGKPKIISSVNLWFERLVHRFQLFEKILNQILI